MNNHRTHFLIFFLFIAFSTSSLAKLAGKGISFPATQVIYPEGEARGIRFTVTNDTGNVYLLQSRVISAEAEDTGDERKVPFIVIPPLIRFEPGATVTLIIRQTGTVPQVDQESLWRLALKTIPAQSNNPVQDGAATVSLVLALQNNLKLFYRPKELPALTTAERAESLKFTQQGGVLSVTNPTPYHVTFSELLTDGQQVNIRNDKTIAPYSTVRYPTGVTSSSRISWSITDDSGRPVERREQSLR